MYKIGDFSKRSDISIKTLRYYDEIDLLKPAFIDKFTGYRYYTNNQLLDIILIKELKKLGLSLELIKEYKETKNIKILKERRKELEMAINSITDFLANRYKEYKITECNYEKYVLINGIKSANCPQGLEVRDGNAKYYVIENNDEFVDDFIIFVKNSNWITINIKNFLDKEYINLIFNYLKKNGYVHLSVYIPKEEKNILKAIRTNFNNIEETMIYQNKLEYIKIQVNL